MSFQKYLSLFTPREINLSSGKAGFYSNIQLISGRRKKKI